MGEYSLGFDIWGDRISEFKEYFLAEDEIVPFETAPEYLKEFYDEDIDDAYQAYQRIKQLEQVSDFDVDACVDFIKTKEGYQNE